jgi:putative ABC transport system permease protein
VWRTTLRSLLAHKLRLALSGLAVVLGVAFVSGTMVFTDTLGKTFTDLFETTSADVNVEPAAAFETGLAGTGGGSATSTVPQRVLDQVAEVPGVEAVQGYVQAEGVYLLTPDGDVLDTGGAPGLGISWDADERLSANTLVEGRAPAAPDEVAVDAAAARDAGYQVGDTITVLTTGPRVEAELVGTFRFGDSGGLAGASLTAFEASRAQELLAEPGAWTSLGVLAAEGSSQEQVRDAVAETVGDGYDVKTRQEQADDLAASFSEGLQFINVFLLAFAGVALFVGSFIILNTFSMLVAQRTRELALLRALGASRAQVTRSVLAEALVLGVVGSTLGLAGGYATATALRALFGQFGLTLDGSLVFALDTVLWSYAVGVLVTLVAAYLPARRAARTAPVAAMRDDGVAPERSLRRRTVGGRCWRPWAALPCSPVSRATAGRQPRRWWAWARWRCCSRPSRSARCWPGRSCAPRERSCRGCSAPPAGSPSRTRCAARGGPPPPPPRSWSGWRWSAPSASSAPRPTPRSTGSSRTRWPRTSWCRPPSGSPSPRRSPLRRPASRACARWRSSGSATRRSTARRPS